MNEYDKIIELLGLKPHPEGGFYSETYRSEEIIRKDCLPERYNGDRSFGTAIYFLLRGQDESRLHRLLSDEIWHFYAGVPLELTYYPESDIRKRKTFILGNDILNGQVPQVVVPRNYLMLAKPIDSSSYTLVGCTTAPGFDFEDFEIF